MQVITPWSIYDSWPTREVLGCGPPEKGAAFAEYYRAAKQTAGDNLFLFVLREMSLIDGDDTGRIVRLNIIMDDLESLMVGLSSVIRATTKSPAASRDVSPLAVLSHDAR